VRSVESRLDIRRFSFSQRVANLWNSLPDSLKGVRNVEEFQIRYDEFVKRLGAR
jgi:hypothetical protein